MPSRPAAMAYFIAMTMSFATLDTLAKYLTADLHVLQIVWGRYVFHVALIACVLLPRLGARGLVSRRPGAQWLRSALIAAITVMFVSTIKFLPLVDVTAIGYVSPLVVTAMGALLLGERVGIRRWMAVAIGFAGMLIIIRPGFAAWHWSLALAAIIPFFNAAYHVWTRVLAGVDHPLTTLLYSGLAGAIAMSLAVPFVWMPLDAAGWLELFGLGLFGTAGHYFMIRAYDHAPASSLAPLHYLQLVWVALLGLIFFANLPDIWTVAGAAIIVASGLYVLHRERVAAIQK